MNNRFIVTIDGEREILSFNCRSHGGYQYMTSDNMAAHTFIFRLRVGMKFITNGHEYRIIEKY